LKLKPGIGPTALAALILALGTGPVPAEEPVRIGNVPFIPQKPRYCGPACLAMVLGHYGAAFSQEQLAAEVYRGELKGALNLELLIAARRHGFQARAEAGSLEGLLGAIAAGIPVIVQVSSTDDSPGAHFMVAYGFDRQRRELIVHSGRERGKVLAWDEFAPRWQATGNWMLLITRLADWP